MLLVLVAIWLELRRCGLLHWHDGLAATFGADAPGDKVIQQHVIDEAATASPKKPVGCKGRTAVAFGGGYTFDQAIKRELEGQDAVQLTPLN